MEVDNNKVIESSLEVDDLAKNLFLLKETVEKGENTFLYAGNDNETIAIDYNKEQKEFLVSNIAKNYLINNSETMLNIANKILFDTYKWKPSLFK